MKIFYRRPLCFACLCFILTFIASVTFEFKYKAMLSILLVLSFICVVVFYKPQHKKYIIKAFLGTSILMTALALLISYAYYDVYLGKRDAFDGESKTVEAVVTREVSRYEHISVYDIKISSIDGNDYSIGATLEFNSDVELYIGDKIQVKGELIKIENYESAEEYKSLYLSGGRYFALICDNYKNCTVVDEDIFLPEVFFAKINKAVSGFLLERIDGESGNLASALLLGNDEMLSDTTVRDFRRCGISHILALSGMHVAIIAGFLDFILKKIYCHKSTRCILLVGLLFGYLFITGFSLSTVRSVLMLTFVYLAYFLKGDSDPLTNLFLSIVLIIAFSPNSIYDAGMWLSFLSVFGILTLGDYFSKAIDKLLSIFDAVKPIQAVLKYILISMSITITVNVCIVLVLRVLFGSISYLTLLTNLFMPFLSMIMVVVSLLVLFIGRVPLVSELLSFIVDKLGTLIIDIAASLSVADNVMVSLNYPFADAILITMTVGIALCLVLNLDKHKYIIATIPIVSLVVFSICLGSYNSYISDRIEASYIRNGESEMIALASNDEYAVIDISNGGYKNMSNAYIELNEFHGYEIDSYVITHYHMLTASNLKRLSSKTILRRVYLPMPLNADEEGIMKVIVRYLSEYDIDFTYYTQSAEVTILDGVALNMHGREYIKRSAQPLIAFSVNFGDDSLLYLSESFSEGEFSRVLPDNAEHIIFGTHGPNLKREYPISNLIGNDTSSLIFANRDSFLMVDFEGEEGYSKIKDCELETDVSSKRITLFSK